MHYLLFYDVVDDYVRRREPFRAAHLAHARRAVARGELVLGGALGNQVDRLALGYVRDYVMLGIRPTDIFNTADMFMVLGALLLLGSLMIHHRT